MNREQVVFLERNKIKEALHALKIYKTIPTNSLLLMTIHDYRRLDNEQTFDILCKIRKLINSSYESGYLEINVIAVSLKTEYFDIGSGPDYYKLSPEKIIKWVRVPKKDLPIYLGWPLKYPSYAGLIRRL